MIALDQAMVSANSVTVGVGSGGGQANDGSLHNVFVYGSLLADDVVRVLLCRIPQNSHAILHSYHRFSTKGRMYHAILPVENDKITGRVTSDALLAYTYVWANSDDPDLYGEWDFEVWKESKMKDFVNMTTGFVEEQELPGSKPKVATYESCYKQNDSKNLSS